MDTLMSLSARNEKFLTYKRNPLKQEKSRKSLYNGFILSDLFLDTLRSSYYPCMKFILLIYLFI